MKKFIYLSLLMVGAAAANTETTQQVVENLYDQLAQKSVLIDTDSEEQRGELQDVLGEVKQIVDDCNDRLNAALTKYPQLRKELGLHGNLTLSLSVDNE